MKKSLILAIFVSMIFCGTLVHAGIIKKVIQGAGVATASGYVGWKVVGPELVKKFPPTKTKEKTKKIIKNRILPYSGTMEEMAKKTGYSSDREQAKQNAINASDSIRKKLGVPF